MTFTPREGVNAVTRNGKIATFIRYNDSNWPAPFYFKVDGTEESYYANGRYEAGALHDLDLVADYEEPITDICTPSIERVCMAAQAGYQTVSMGRMIKLLKAITKDRDTLAKQVEDCARTCAEQAEEIQKLHAAAQLGLNMARANDLTNTAGAISAALQSRSGDANRFLEGYNAALDESMEIVRGSGSPGMATTERLIRALKPEPDPGQIERVSLADLEGYGTNNAPRHPDNEAVDRFAAAMKAKLAVKRADGRGGWDDKAQCSQQFLSDLLRGHVDKGDPVDVANFAMMLHQRGEVVAPAPEVEAAPITFRYTNWRGETAQRTAVPRRIWFGSTDWHPEPGYLMTAHDLEKGADRDFALADCDFTQSI